MSILMPFSIGLLASILGTIPPGILNATIVRIYKEEGNTKANNFALGTLSIIALQVYLSVYFSKIIHGNTQIHEILREIGIVIFLILSVFFFSKKKQAPTPIKISKQKNRYWHGVLMSLLNIFPIFYYVFISITASNNQWYPTTLASHIALTVGVLLGTYIAFRLYIITFRKTNIHTNPFLKNTNKLLAWLTLLIAMFNIYKLLYA